MFSVKFNLSFYVENQDYKDTSDEVLSWEYRHKLIIRELDQERYLTKDQFGHLPESLTSPDVICFQEYLDTEITNYLMNESKIKYDFVSQQKQRNKQDSIATFWNKDVFEKIDSWYLNIDTAQEWEIYRRPQVALYLALRFKDSSQHFYQLEDSETQPKDVILLLCNSHLLFNNNRGDVKLSQADIMAKGKEMNPIYALT